MTAQSMPPSDIDAEQAVLGAMMLNADALAGCLELLAPVAPDVFMRPAHQLVFEAISHLANEGEPVDVITVKAEMERRKTLRCAGDGDYLHTILAAVPAPASCPAYARDLLDLYTRRELKSASQTIGQIADDPGDRTRSEMAEAAYRVLDRISAPLAESRAVAASELFLPLLDALEAGHGTVRGVMTGWTDLDLLFGGFRPGQLIVIGGRPSMGKSVVLQNIATYAAMTAGHRVLFCSLEMSRTECMERLLSHVAEVPLYNIRNDALTSYDWERIAKAQLTLSSAATLLIEDSTDLTVHDIRAMLRSMARAGTPAHLVAVDYLQLMGSAASKGRPENRQAEIAEITRGLKKLAKEFSVPVLVGSQVNRGPEMRSDKRPVAADLRESGSLESHADIVILLYREDAYERESPRAGEIDLITAKNRQGPQSTVTLAFRGHFAMCADLYRGPA